VERKAALQHAIDEITRQRAEIERLRRGTRDPIAIVGMACRLPGAPTVSEYWDLLARGGDAVTEVPRERWNADAFYDADPSVSGKMMTRQGAFIRGVDQFDPHFFGIAPREAQHMDPQQRLLLEVAWEALEHANIPPSELYGTATGVFVGITCFDHAIRISRAPGNFNAYAGTGSALNMAPGRLSYVLGLTGPSMAVDTACSSSLVCLHLACQSLASRESNAAIVGGVHLILSPEVMVSFSQARMLAADGRSKTFDDTADGYSRGEGCGVVVLKRYADAVAHGDTILGVIRGTAVNQDGPSGGLTVPNGAAQQQVIRRALESAGLAPAAVGYVETHGTGTPLGDPIEVEALATVYGDGRPKGSPLLIGSVKTNIGHLEPAAGMAGLIKILLAFQHERLPRHLHFHTPNAHIPWSAVPVKVVGDSVAWPRADTPRVAGLSAFGFSGTNTHVIIEEPPAPRAPAARPATRWPQVLPLSAKSDSALRALASRYVALLAEDPDRDLAPIAFTAGIGRVHFPHRLTVLASTTSEAREALEACIANQPSPAVRTGKAANADYRRDGADVKARLVRAYESNALTDVADLYLEGVAIDWTRLFEGEVPARVTLPTYPFERQRYWVDTPDQDAPPSASSQYQLVWTRVGAAGTDVAACRDRRWMIVPGDQELADRVRDVLAAHGAAAAAARATDIIFIGGAHGAVDAGDPCAGLLALTQALVSAGGASPRIWVVTRGAIPVTGEMTETGAAHAPLAAFARVVGLEHPELFGRLIDLDPVAGTDDAATLLAEVLHDDVEDQIALRSGHRYGQRVEPVSQVSMNPEALLGDAMYLVTGGLGRIGLLVARDLVRRGARHLCLLGRSGVSTPEQRSALAGIEAQGAAVRVVTGDVADRAAMASLMQDLSAGPPLAGVVHAAGLPGYVDLEHLAADALARVLRPKIQGAWNLHELTRDLPLDFFVCFSSISSAWGSRGQAHYAAANAYLDALAYLRRSAGLPAVTINWGPWVEGGMTTPEAETLLRRVGIRPLPTVEALAALAALSRGGRPQTVVADIDWTLFKGSYEARGHRRLLERLRVPTGTPTDAGDNALVREIAQAAPEQRERLLTEAIGREVAEVLELPDASQVDPSQGLFEMGMDSLMALELRTRLQALVSRALPATLVFDCPTIHAIARFLAGELDGGAAATPAAAIAQQRDTGIDALSDADAEALLLKKLESIR
jgi:acyl transferase domain-containing protein/acyl carrier protein